MLQSKWKRITSIIAIMIMLITVFEKSTVITYANSEKPIPPWSYTNGKFYNDVGQEIPGATRKGIDVSKWQGKIDWALVKKSDVAFAIIRCGYGDNLVSQDDDQWKTNADACTKLGIPFGTYIYSYATTTAQAKSEADHVLRLIKGYNLTYPVYFDMEDAVQARLTTRERVNIAKTFCDAIEKAGYKVGIYANTYWFNTYLNDPFFDTKDRWVAQYASKCTYAGKYNMWQSTSSGSVPGIKGNVDINFMIGTDNLTPTESVKVNQENIEMLIGTTQTLKATVRPLNTGDQLVWKSSDKTVASVDKNGKVKALKDGTVNITATSGNKTYTTKCIVYNIPVVPVLNSVKNAGTSSVSLSWNEARWSEGYKIYRAASKNGTYKEISTVEGGTTTSSKVSAKTGQTYYYKIEAYRKVGNSVISSELSNTKSGMANIKTPVISEAKNHSATQIRLTWNPVADADGYEIYRSTKENGTYKLIKTINKQTTKTYKRSATIGKNYFYKMRAFIHVDGKKVYSKESKIQELKLTLGKPEITKAKMMTAKSIRLNWNPVEQADGYKIYRADSGSSKYTLIHTIKRGNKASYTDAISKGNNYNYKIRAYKTVNGKEVLSSYSKVCRTTAVPNAPSLKNIKEVDKSSVQLRWNHIEGAKGYVVYRATSETGKFKTLRTIKNRNTTTCNVSAATGKTYYYKVVAYNNSGAATVYSRDSKIKAGTAKAR